MSLLLGLQSADVVDSGTTSFTIASSGQDALGDVSAGVVVLELTGADAIRDSSAGVVVLELTGADAIRDSSAGAVQVELLGAGSLGDGAPLELRLVDSGVEGHADAPAVGGLRPRRFAPRIVHQRRSTQPKPDLLDTGMFVIQIDALGRGRVVGIPTRRLRDDDELASLLVAIGG